MPAKRFVLVVTALLVAAPLAAQEGSDLRDLFGGLLRGSQGEEREADKRIPFSRQEMQLSFAPLVKETAPAVVNVYASQQVQQVSPFMGDPFFERFFGGGRM